MVFEFESVSDFKAKIESKDLEISKEIYKQIEFILERDQWVVSLNTCLNVFADNDMFEECIEIQKILKILDYEYNRDK